MPEALLKKMFAPVGKTTDHGRAMGGPRTGHGEVVPASAACLMKEAMEERSGGRGRAMPPRRSCSPRSDRLAIAFGAIGLPFSDRREVAIRWGTEHASADWRRSSTGADPDRLRECCTEGLKPARPGVTSMSDLRFSVLGCGFWSRFQIAAWREVGGTSCCALQPHPRQGGGARPPNLRPNGLRRCPRSSSAARSSISSTSSPTSDHADFVRLAAKHGVPVICQKPMAPDYAPRSAWSRPAARPACPSWFTRMAIGSIRSARCRGHGPKWGGTAVPRTYHGIFKQLFQSLTTSRS